MAYNMDYWYLWVIFAVLCVITVFVLIKASAAGKQHKIDSEREIKELERLRALKDKFTSFDKKTAESTDARTLLDGVCVVMQVMVEKSENSESEFSEFSMPRRFAYTLNYLIEDCEAQSLSFFFKNNGEPLISLASEALDSIDETELSDICSRVFSMFDENNEDVSLDNDELKKLDSQFLTKCDFGRVLSKIKLYIIAHIADFQ